VKVATYNLWGNNEPWQYTLNRGVTRGAVPGSRATTLQLPDGLWQRRRQLLVHVLRQALPDILGLQEVVADVRQTEQSQAHQLARALGYLCVFQPLSRLDDGISVGGLAVVSRYPILSHHDVPLTTTFTQAALHTVIDTPAGLVNFIVVHLTPQSEEAQVVAIHHLHHYLDTLPRASKVIIVGDFNAPPNAPSIHMLTRRGTVEDTAAQFCDAWLVINPHDPGPTMPSHAPVSRIDYVFVSSSLSVLNAQRIGHQADEDGFYASDHLGLVVTLQLVAGGVTMQDWHQLNHD